MRFPLIASWMDAGTAQCLWDDGNGDFGIEDLASPQGVVLLDFEQPTIDAVLAQALTEYLDAFDPDDQPKGEWHTTEWNLAVCNQTWWWGDDEANPDVVVVVREATTYGGGGPA